MVKVSVVIPTLNEEENIIKAIKSIKEQSYVGDVEIIVADSDSKDKTRDFAVKSGAVVYNVGRGKGAGDTRKRGAVNASGKYLLFMDADSIGHKDWIKEFVQMFETDSKIVAGSGKIYPLEKDVKLEKMYCDYLLDPIANTTSKLKIPMVYGINFGVRKDIYDEVGGFNTTLVTCEDTDLAARMQKHGKIGYASKAVVYTSMRRVKDMGSLTYAWFHLCNHFRFYCLGKSSNDYDPVRK